jgi:hypothetical protein
MPVDLPPPPPRLEQPAENASRAQAPIEDMRERFERTTPQTPEDEARTRAFIDGKIEMIRRDPRMTDAEKDAAIADLEAKRYGAAQPR